FLGIYYNIHGLGGVGGLGVPSILHGGCLSLKTQDGDPHSTQISVLCTCLPRWSRGSLPKSILYGGCLSLKPQPEIPTPPKCGSLHISILMESGIFTPQHSLRRVSELKSSEEIPTPLKYQFYILVLFTDTVIRRVTVFIFL
ncbi:MAG: hypothetical protein QG603_270, partial [Patescibacteria group bacterium]|nr:hypothetical protein [Patescibacteria group bacterium]